MTGPSATAAPKAESKGGAHPPWGHAMSPAWWHLDNRFPRLGEAEQGGGIGKGGYGVVFNGFDQLRQKQVVIKRQPPETAAAAREIAAYRMLEAFPHPNLLRMHGTWTAQFDRTAYLYIAMEACSTSLWKCIGVGNPAKRANWLTTNKRQQIMLGIVRGAGHLHELGVVHGDLSMSNILLTSELEAKVADFGAVTGHTFLTPDKLCVAYIRPPEAILGSERKARGVDTWAVAITALALYTSQVPTLLEGNDDAGEAERSKYVFRQTLTLLPPLTDSIWPEHSTLPLWDQHKGLQNLCPAPTACGCLSRRITSTK